MQPSAFFQLVADPSEKMKILLDLAEGRREILCKTAEPGAALLRAEAVTVIGSSLMIRPQKLGVIDFEEKNLIIQFQLGNQKYISLVPFKRSEDMIALSMTAKLFRVQRREFYRLKVPGGYRGTLNIEAIGTQSVQKAFQLVDLSGGGCKIEVPPLKIAIQMAVPFSATLKLPKHGDFKLRCIIRHQSQVQAQPENRWIGVQFVEQTEQDSNRLAALVMDLHREFFSRI